MNYCKVLCVICLALGIAAAKSNGSNVLTKGKYLLSYEEVYEDVWVVGKAQSTKTKCSARVDVSHMLVQVGDCDVESIGFFTKDSMWLGNVLRGSYDGEKEYEANYSYRGVYYSFNIKDAAYMKVSFKHERKQVNEDNLWRVSCPKDYLKSFDEAGFGFCYKPYQCEKNEYSLDEKTCAPLPKNGKRLEEAGWECLDGYALYEGEDTIFCYKSYQCAKGEYSIDEQTCEKLPPHAKRLEEEGFACVDGFAKVESIDTAYCEKKVKCKPTELYVERENDCYSLPDHASWRENATEPSDFDCDEGYKYNTVTYQCQQLVTECDSNSVISNDEFSCVEIPVDSHKADEYRWNCNVGFGEKNGECFQLARCSSFEYNKDPFTCEKLPDHAHVKDYYGWECDDGFVTNGRYCFAIPANSHVINNGWAWECDSGYQEDDGTCRKLAVCNSNQYKLSDYICATLPAHAHEVYGNTWACDEGYVNVNYNVCDAIPDCGERSILNRSYNQCEDIPTHAEKSAEDSWRCKDGYHIEYDGSRQVCKHDPLGIQNNLSLEIAGSMGSQSVDNSDNDNTTEDNPFFMEGNVGVEWLFGEKFNFGPAISLAIIYAEHPDDLSYLSTRLNLAAIIAIGSNKFHFYGRPFISTNLTTSAKYQSETNVSTSYKVPASIAGLELGIRLGDSYNKNFAVDLYLGFMENPFKDTQVDDEAVIYFGARIVAF